MEFPRCKTCDYWTLKDLSSMHSSMWKPVNPDLTPMDIGYEVRSCQHPEKTFAEVPLSKSGFGLIDGHEYHPEIFWEYYAELFTAENFGCVRHSGQEKKNT